MNESNQIAGNGEQNSQLALDQSLSEFLLKLGYYTPIIPDAVTAYYLHTSGFASNDPRLQRVISIAAQKFISDIVNDALQHCKMRSSNSASSGSGSESKDRRYCLTLEDLTAALAEYGISVKKPSYYE